MTVRRLNRDGSAPCWPGGDCNGARHAYLQVVEANQPARTLYHALGFCDLYRYWYRVAP